LTTDLHLKSVEELAPLLASKSLSPVELTKAILDFAEESQPKINSYMAFYREEALARAKEVEQEILQGHYKGMYHGIPIK